MEKKKVLTKWLYWFTFAVAVIFVYKTLDNFTEIKNWITNLFSVLAPFIIGILIAYIFYIPAKKLECIYCKSKINIINKKARGLSVLTVYVIVILLIILIINFIVPALSESITELLNNIPTYFKSAEEYINNIPEESILNKINIQEILSQISQTDLKALFNIENLTGYAKGLIGVASWIFSIFVTIIVSIYLLLDRSKIVNFLKRFSKAMFKEKTYKAVSKYFTKSNVIFFRFVYSQLLDGIIIGIITSIAMSLLGVKYAVLLGFMIGLFNLIPYFGAIIAVALAIIITIFTGGFMQALWMAIIVIILQQIDANIINPKIVGNSLKLSPLMVIFAVTVGGAYFGVLGMFLAVPIITVMKLILNDYIDYKQNNKLQKET